MRIHLVCAFGMLAACAFIGWNLKHDPWFEHFLLLGEWVAIWGFSISWLVQGWAFSSRNVERRTKEELRLQA